MPASTAAPSGRYYYANGEKVYLAPSRRFVAVRAAGDDAQSAASIAAELAPLAGGQPLNVMPLPQYGLALVAVDAADAPGVAPGRPEAGGVLTFLESDRTKLEAGPQVYELPSMPEDAVVIPVGQVIVQFKPQVPQSQRDTLLKKTGAVDIEADDMVANRYVLKLRQEDQAIDVANRLQEEDTIEYAEPNLVTVMTRPSSMEPPAVSDDVDAPDADGREQLEPSRMRTVHLREALELQRTQEAEETEVSTTGPLATPNDPGFPQQWGLQKIRAPEAWEIHRGNAGVIIAVLDEGCDVAHEDIAYQLPGYDSFDNDNDPTPSGNDAHGTACAGIISMRHNNGRGGVGVAPGCRVLPVRIARGIGGGFWETDALKVDRAIRTAVARGAAVLSNSYSLSPSTMVTQAFQHAQTSGRGGLGCVMAAASGNADVRGIIFPARLSPTIRGFMAVGSSNQWDQRKSKTSADGETWWGSNYGPELDVVAPGVRIYTADISGSAGYSSNSYVSNFNGTSSATPHVAGLMGLVLSVDPGLRGWEVEEIIKLTARDLGPAGRDEQFGFGRIDARRALEAASRLWSRVLVTPVFLGSGQDCFFRMYLRLFNSGINTVRVNNVIVRSHTADWSAEVDRFEYTPNPGGVMLARAGHHLTFPRILLQANGNRRAWSYRYSISWSYTFWRPSAPGLPLTAPDAVADGAGEDGHMEALRGSAEGTQRTTAAAPGARGEIRTGTADETRRAAGPEQDGDTVLVDRERRSITIVIR